MENTDLRILFPTNFSNSCFSAVRAISYLADKCRVGLTIAHVARPGSDAVKTRRELDSFLAEADHYDDCRRILLEGDSPVEAIAALCNKNRYDLVVAPSSDHLGLHRLFRASFRARLIQMSRSPVWTAGASILAAACRPHIKTIACLMDFDADTNSYLRLAASLASRIGARLQLVHVVPQIHEGTLAHALGSRAPLMPEIALDRIRQIFAGSNCPDVEVAIGDVDAQLPRLLRKCEADLAFVGPGQALRWKWRAALARGLDRLPCPAICVDGASAHFPQWTFEAESRSPEAFWAASTMYSDLEHARRVSRGLAGLLTNTSRVNIGD